jgi:hypothetical protein
MLRAGVCGFQPLVGPSSERCLWPPNKALGRSRASLGRLAMERPFGPISRGEVKGPGKILTRGAERFNQGNPVVPIYASQSHV